MTCDDSCRPAVPARRDRFIVCIDCGEEYSREDIGDPAPLFHAARLRGDHEARAFIDWFYATPAPEPDTDEDVAAYFKRMRRHRHGWQSPYNEDRKSF